MIRIKIESAAITHVGLVRGNNEDNYYVNGKYKVNNNIATEGYKDTSKRDSYLYAVCDGMGGENLGEVASMIAVETLADYQSTDIQRTVKDYIKRANKYICDEIIKNNGVRSGTTLALLYICDNKAVSYNVGDSRVYLLRKGDLYLMSEDHTEAQQMVNMGLLDEEDAENHSSRNVLTQYLGIFPEEHIVEPYISQEIKIKKKDIFLLCSDGVTDMIDNDDIGEILTSKNTDTVELAKQLAAAAQTHGGRDNATVVVVKVG